MDFKIPDEVTVRIAEALEELTATYKNTEVSEHLVKMWARGVGDLHPDAIEYGLVRVAREWKGTWMITPAEFRALTITEQGNTFEDQATGSWLKVELAMKNCGAYDGISFDDTIITESIRVLGGWRKLTHMEIDKIQWFKKDFIKEYVSILKSGRTDFKKYLLSSNKAVYLGAYKPRLNFVGQIEDKEKELILIVLDQDSSVVTSSTKLLATGGSLSRIKSMSNKLKSINEIKKR
jgi:hypothetical protein